MFDYLYYRTYDIYQKKWKENMPWLYAWCLVTLLQGLNIMLIGITAFTLLQIKLPKDGKTLIILLCAAIFAFNYFRYTRLYYSKLKNRWEDEPPEKRKYKGWLIILYIVFSFPVTIWLFTVLGKMNNAL